ncbi:hypothetical protein GCM10009715_22900 [Paeniglutamicibacter psychrophenolicus]
MQNLYEPATYDQTTFNIVHCQQAHADRESPGPHHLRQTHDQGRILKDRSDFREEPGALFAVNQPMVKGQ